jgi:hypothetical protein
VSPLWRTEVEHLSVDFFNSVKRHDSGLGHGEQQGVFDRLILEEILLKRPTDGIVFRNTINTITVWSVDETDWFIRNLIQTKNRTGSRKRNFRHDQQVQVIFALRLPSRDRAVILVLITPSYPHGAEVTLGIHIGGSENNHVVFPDRKESVVFIKPFLRSEEEEVEVVVGRVFDSASDFLPFVVRIGSLDVFIKSSQCELVAREEICISVFVIVAAHCFSGRCNDEESANNVDKERREENFHFLLFGFFFQEKTQNTFLSDFQFQSFLTEKICENKTQTQTKQKFKNPSISSPHLSLISCHI